MTLTDEELYEGFTQEQRERYEREVKEMYDPELVEISNQRVRKMSKQQWQAVKDEGDAVTRALANVMDMAPESSQVQELIARHHAWIENFYPANGEIYRGLGKGYAEHPEFRTFYEKYRPGLADFMCAAITVYANTVLVGKTEA